MVGSIYMYNTVCKCFRKSAFPLLILLWRIFCIVQLLYMPRQEGLCWTSDLAMTFKLVIFFWRGTLKCYMYVHKDADLVICFAQIFTQQYLQTFYFALFISVTLLKAFTSYLVTCLHFWMPTAYLHVIEYFVKMP